MLDVPEFKFCLVNGFDDSYLPKRATETDTGWDVRAAITSELVVKPGDYFKIPLGFKCFCPPGWYYRLHPRSSSFVKKYMHTLIGIIDEAYPLECILAGLYLPPVSLFNKDLVIKKGDVIAQIIPVKRQEMFITNITSEEFDDLCRGRASLRSGGFGSTTTIK